MVLGVSEAVGLALTTVGVSQVPVLAGVRATWRTGTFNYNDAYAPLLERIETQQMQLRMISRRDVFATVQPMDFPETIAAEKLQLARQALEEASEMCQEYETLSVDAQNAWGREKGSELLKTVENAERKMSLVARFVALRSQELVKDMAERLFRIEEFMVAEQVERGGADGGEEGILNHGQAENEQECEDQGAVHSDGEEEGIAGIAGGLAAPAVWIMVALCAVTVLVRVGRQL